MEQIPRRKLIHLRASRLPSPCPRPPAGRGQRRAHPGAAAGTDWHEHCLPVSPVWSKTAPGVRCGLNFGRKDVPALWESPLLPFPRVPPTSPPLGPTSVPHIPQGPAPLPPTRAHTCICLSACMHPPGSCPPLPPSCSAISPHVLLEDQSNGPFSGTFAGGGDASSASGEEAPAPL